MFYATCPDPLMICPFCYEACLKAFILCLKIHLYALIHSQHGQKWRSLCQFLLRSVCYVVFAKSFIYAQDHMWHWQNYMWHSQIHLLTLIIELFLDMTQAWNPAFIKYPLNYTFIELIIRNQTCIFLARDLAGEVAQW